MWLSYGYIEIIDSCWVLSQRDKETLQKCQVGDGKTLKWIFGTLGGWGLLTIMFLRRTNKNCSPFKICVPAMQILHDRNGMSTSIFLHLDDVGITNASSHCIDYIVIWEGTSIVFYLESPEGALVSNFWLITYCFLLAVIVKKSTLEGCYLFTQSEGLISYKISKFQHLNEMV